MRRSASVSSAAPLRTSVGSGFGSAQLSRSSSYSQINGSSGVRCLHSEELIAELRRRLGDDNWQPVATRDSTHSPSVLNGSWQRNDVSRLHSDEFFMDLRRRLDEQREKLVRITAQSQAPSPTPFGWKLPQGHERVSNVFKNKDEYRYLASLPQGQRPINDWKYPRANVTSAEDMLSGQRSVSQGDTVLANANDVAKAAISLTDNVRSSLENVENMAKAAMKMCQVWPEQGIEAMSRTSLANSEDTFGIATKSLFTEPSSKNTRAEDSYHAPGHGCPNEARAAPVVSSTGPVGQPSPTASPPVPKLALESRRPVTSENQPHPALDIKNTKPPESTYKSSPDAGPLIEEGIGVGSHVIAKLKQAWIGTPYVYAKVEALSPLAITNERRNKYFAKDLVWLMLAADDGWLAPDKNDWQQPGRMVLIQLMSQEWISAKVATSHVPQVGRAGPLHLMLEGVDNLTSVCVQTDVAFVFTAHELCIEEFGHANPTRGGHLAQHIAMWFAPEKPVEGKTQEDALREQRRRWVTVSRTDGQYPLRSVWVHPQIKEGALNEFAHRASQKKLDCPTYIEPEAVLLVGPPAAGKSSIGRLKSEQLDGSLKCLRKTVSSMKYREEVNNDNLTDCMPGFAFEYKYALQINEGYKKNTKKLWQRGAKLAVDSKRGSFCRSDTVRATLERMKDSILEELSAEAWALRWLTYLVYHHGPVRDSLALDIIKVTIVDASELPVYYSSCMAGKAIGRAMQIMDLSHSTTKPVKHKALPFRGFWPYTSQEARFDRQAGRAQAEKEEGKLKGGNLDSNLVDLHYHAQQAETNITKMLSRLHRGLKATDENDAEEEETSVAVDHFLVIDNESGEPYVLLDFATEDNAVDGDLRTSLIQTVTDVISRRKLFDKEWDAFDPHLFKICYFFLKTCARQDHPLVTRGRALKRERKLEGPFPHQMQDVLPMVTEIDEEIFVCKYGKRSTATETDNYRGNEDIGDAARKALQNLSLEMLDHLKSSVSVMRKYTCLTMMRAIKREGDWEDRLIDEESSIRFEA